MATVSISPKFQKAAEDVKKLKEDPPRDDMLQLYCLYKTGRGEDFSKVKKPGVLDPYGRAKYNAWEKFDRSMSPTVAQKKYVEMAEQLISTIGTN